jgi:hypothetical protein
VADSSRSLRSAKPGANAREHLERSAKPVPGLAAAPLAPQPRAIEQVRAGGLQPDARAARRSIASR